MTTPMHSEHSESTKADEEEDFKVELLPEDYAQYDLSFKLIVIGDSGVGKSCLTTKAVKNNFEDYYQATVGFEFLTFNMRINDMVIKMQIWDTCGQEIYRSLISNFYRNSSLAVILYSIDNRESFEHAENWLSDLKSQANEDSRQVSKEEGMKYKTDQGLDLFMETSAKTGYNARNVLIEAAKILYADYLKYIENNPQGENVPGQVKKNSGLKKDDKNNKKKKGCC